MIEHDKPRVVIVGAGLAGMAAAIALAERNVAVELLESKRFLGGRAGSFEDPTTGETLDHCQHVAMGCCTSFVDFAMRTGMDHAFRVDDTLHFFGPDNRHYPFRASRRWPAPLHLMPALWGLKFLSFRSRISIALAMRRLARRGLALPDITVARWLADMRQSLESIEQYWKVVLVSALGETLDKASLASARKVFVDGFMSNAIAYQLLVPLMPLMVLYEKYVSARLLERNVKIRRSAIVSELVFDESKATGVRLSSGETVAADQLILATPWRVTAKLARGTPLETQCQNWSHIETSPITGVHLWFDRAITDLPHAVLVGKLSQWLFARYSPDQFQPSAPHAETYYQVVISASRELTGRDHGDVVREVVSDLKATFPLAKTARLTRSRVVTQNEAVFSVTPELDAIRPVQETSISGLTLAGDWTTTSWPATMEGAVRSGYLAAEAVLKSLGQSAAILPPPLPQSWLMRFF